MVSSKRTSGTTSFAVRLVNAQGLESDNVDAGTITILSAPLVTESNQNKSTLAIKATGQAGATAKIYDNVTLVGTVAIGADGTFAFATIPMSLW